MDKLLDYETPRDDAVYYSSISIPGYDLEAGLRSKKHDRDAIAKNDDLLVERFARWTWDNIDRYCKFTVIYEPLKLGDTDRTKEGIQAAWVKTEETVKRLKTVGKHVSFHHP